MMSWAETHPPLPVPDELATILPALDIHTVFSVADGDIDGWATAVADPQVRCIVARHPVGGAAMAGAYAWTIDKVAVFVLHQVDGLAAALPGILGAITSGAPLLVLSFHPHVGRPEVVKAQAALLRAAGALVLDVPEHGKAQTVLALGTRAARERRRPVVVQLSYNQGEAPLRAYLRAPKGLRDLPAVPTADSMAVEDLAALIAQARRPLFVVGRGAVHARLVLEQLADRAGALLATSAAAYGLFAGNPWSLGVIGALATPEMAELIAAADLVISWGCSLDPWATRQGKLIAAEAELAQVDIDPAALGLHCRIDLGVAGDARHTAEAVHLALPPRRTGYRTAQVRERIASYGTWHDVGYQPVLESDDRIDPRTLSLLLDTILPEERMLAVERGTVMGPPISYLRVPDAEAFCLCPTRGLALATGIGAALARPDRVTVAVLDVGGAIAAISELETAARVRAPVLIVVYDEERPTRHDLDSAPNVDLVQIAAGHGCQSSVIRRPADLTVVSEWLAGPRQHPLLLHARVTRCAWWHDDLVPPPAS